MLSGLQIVHKLGRRVEYNFRKNCGKMIQQTIQQTRQLKPFTYKAYKHMAIQLKDTERDSRRYNGRYNRRDTKEECIRIKRMIKK